MKSSIISGSFNTITNDLTKHSLVDLYAFTPYTIDLIEEVLHHAGIIVTPEELKEISDAILVLDMCEMSHASFTEELSYTKRKKLYEEERTKFMQALETTESALFRQHTHRQIQQGIICKLGGKSLASVKMSSQFNDQFDFSESTALMTKLKAFPHTEQDQRINMNQYYLQTIVDIDARALLWVLSNANVLAILTREEVDLDALTCVYFQKQASVFALAPAYVAQRDANIRKRAEERARECCEDKREERYVSHLSLLVIVMFD